MTSSYQDDWFENPLDSMTKATDHTLKEEDHQDPPAELMEVTTSVKNPKPKKKRVEAELSLHEKMYRYATDKYNPFSVGGSESIHDFE